MSEQKMSRATYAQMQEMLDFFEKHRLLALGRPPKSKLARYKLLWCSLTAKLNSMNGAVKDVSTWKKCWNDKRTGVKRLAAKYKQAIRQTGGRCDQLPELSTTDLKIIELLGIDISTPMSEVAGSTFPQSVKKIEPESEPASEPTLKRSLSPNSTSNDSETHQNNVTWQSGHDSDALSENSETAEPMMEHFIMQPDILGVAQESAENHELPRPKKRRIVDDVREQLMGIEERRVDAEVRLAGAVERLGMHLPSQEVMQAILVTTEAQQETARAQADAAREQSESARQQVEAARQQAEAARQQAEASRQQAEAARLQAEVARAMLEEIRSRNGK